VSFGGDLVDENSNEISPNQSSFKATENNDTASSIAINLNAKVFEAMDLQKGTWCFGYDFTEQNDYFDTQFTGSPIESPLTEHEVNILD